jgi:hypothetical protein
LWSVGEGATCRHYYACTDKVADLASYARANDADDIVTQRRRTYARANDADDIVTQRRRTSVSQLDQPRADLHVHWCRRLRCDCNHKHRRGISVQNQRHARVPRLEARRDDLHLGAGQLQLIYR